ncbi:myogenesis-regulating glycosidase-like [Penaeus monodon]|uniref:myogenesis-regulating glycosidase-like n=1 Tax=Penaeus monodon TaxID=6687 RepID=UPI0018A79648|nr:myogenesis-regulating glycosidase-like [Penaeus monodon]
MRAILLRLRLWVKKVQNRIEIDDNWETYYGDAVFNPDRFPDPKRLFDDLKNEGYRVTVWIHPFINDDCDSYAYADEHGYFVKLRTRPRGLGGQQTSRWRGRHSGIITNPAAAEWWGARLLKLRQETGLDNDKFDAGEASWLPEVFTPGVDERFWPSAYTFKSPRLDLVLPDMNGGNAYVIKPSAELFVRWAQANSFMPSLQFSLLPWDFDKEQTNFAPSPMLRPTWGLCPTDEDCLVADQREYCYQLK